MLFVSFVSVILKNRDYVQNVETRTILDRTNIYTLAQAVCAQAAERGVFLMATWHLPFCKTRHFRLTGGLFIAKCKSIN